MKKLMTKVEVLRYLGQRYGTHCGGVEFGLSVGSSAPVVVDKVHDVHLEADATNDMWEEDNDDFLLDPPPTVVVPLLEEFQQVVREVF